MATTRPQIPPTNLKERIAALEQRNSSISVSSTSRATSPTPSTVSSNGATGPGLRDKIAKFERKGGVPVPRGSFGLGAPPTVEGPRKRGELYGNRIPAPARAFSGTHLPEAARASSPTFTDVLGVGSPGASPTSTIGDRRSFSLSSVISDLEDARDSPVTSPTFAFPPDSPDSGFTMGYTPEASPTLPAAPAISKSILRGTSFQKAMEIARNAEISKLENGDTHTAAMSENAGPAFAESDTTPDIVVSSAVPSDIEAQSGREPKSQEVDSFAGPAQEVLDAKLEVAQAPQTEAEAPPVSVKNAPTVVVHAPAPSPDVIIPTPEVVVQSPPTPTVVIHQASEVKPVIHTPSTNTETKAITPQEPKSVVSEELPSPLDSDNASNTSLTDMVGDYFKSNDGTSRPATPPSKPLVSPMSPYATLAYDVPETPEKEPQGRPATIEVPDAQAFLSPPPTTSFRSSAPSSGGTSLGSMSSLGSRPMSMIETANNTQLSRAMRMTPATGRGVPMFFPPSSAATRKSDFVYFPPTPVEDEFGIAIGSPSMHKATQSLSLGVNGAPESPAFAAVVHGKVRDVPASASLAVPESEKPARAPETPRVNRVKRMTMMEPPASPGNAELAALLQEAMWLESSLDRGELPTETFNRQDAEDAQRKADEAAAAAAAAEAQRAEAEERQRIAAAAARLQAKRDEPTSGRLKHTFLVPLSKARTTHRKEVSAPEAPRKSQEEVRPKSAGMPERSATMPAKKSQSQARRPVTPDNDTVSVSQSQHLETPPKSAKTSRFAGFRRLGSMSARPTTIHGHSTRTSVSTMSSDSTNVLTPPEAKLEFHGARKVSVDEFGGLSANDSMTSFPSLSPKKSASSMGRAASFAERVFSRTRTRSNGSHLSTASESPVERIPEGAPMLPSIAIESYPFSSNLEVIPDTPAIVLPVSDTETRVIHPPKRSASLKRSSRLPPLPTEIIPPLPAITPSAFFSTTAEGFPSGALLLPETADATRPTSWTSMSSAGSLPSPLFDQALFDAFPSVPEMTPALSGTRSVHQVPFRGIDSAIANDRPSFDSDLLSSAIHLAGTRKSTAPIVAAPPSALGPSRATTPAPRRSGESAR